MAKLRKMRTARVHCAGDKIYSVLVLLTSAQNRKLRIKVMVQSHRRSWANQRTAAVTTAVTAMTRRRDFFPAECLWPCNRKPYRKGRNPRVAVFKQDLCRLLDTVYRRIGGRHWHVVVVVLLAVLHLLGVWAISQECSESFLREVFRIISRVFYYCAYVWGLEKSPTMRFIGLEWFTSILG